MYFRDVGEQRANYGTVVFVGFLLCQVSVARETLRHVTMGIRGPLERQIRFQLSHNPARGRATAEVSRSVAELLTVWAQTMQLLTTVANPESL